MGGGYAVPLVGACAGATQAGRRCVRGCWPLALGRAARARRRARRAAQEDDQRSCIYTGTTGYRHADAINPGRAGRPDRARGRRLRRSTGRTATTTAAARTTATTRTRTRAIFTDANLAQYDAILLFNASAIWAGGGRPGPLWDAGAAATRSSASSRTAAASPPTTTRPTWAPASVSWDWWDGGNDSAVGTLMKGHAAHRPEQRRARSRSPTTTTSRRATSPTRTASATSTTTSRAACAARTTCSPRSTSAPTRRRQRDGPGPPDLLVQALRRRRVADGTGTPKPYNDGRVWITGMGHFGAAYTANGGDNELVKHIVGGVRWVAGEGQQVRLLGHGVVELHADDPRRRRQRPDRHRRRARRQGLLDGDRPDAGLRSPRATSRCTTRRARPNNKTTVATIPTRADHGNSEDGVLGMTLEPGFDLARPGEARRLRLLLAAQPGLADDRRPRSSSATTRSAASRSTPPARRSVPDSERVILQRAEGEDLRQPVRLPGRPDRQRARPRRRRRAGLRLRRQPLPRRRRRRLAERARPRPLPADGLPRQGALGRAQDRGEHGRPARQDPAHHAAGRHRGRHRAGRRTPRTRSRRGTCSPAGTAKTRPEIYAMGFRQPFTVQADPANPGTRRRRRVLPRQQRQQRRRARRRGVCEWNLVDEPGFMGWPFCMGDNAPINTSFALELRRTNATTGQQYDCSLDELPTDLRWAPDGADAGASRRSTGSTRCPARRSQATVWKKYAGAPGGQSRLDFGDLSAGGMSPVTGPVYRYDAETAEAGRLPAVLRRLVVHRQPRRRERLLEGGPPARGRQRDAAGQRLGARRTSSARRTPNPVIPSRFGPDGALYMARWHNGCCRNEARVRAERRSSSRSSSRRGRVPGRTREPPNTNHRSPAGAHPSEEGDVPRVGHAYGHRG